jgi:ABC-type multidrug transport system ATPase subunit/ABC-type multidrug transport system permease subunit
MADQETPAFLKNILYQDEVTGKIIHVFGSLWTLFPNEADPLTQQARAKIDEGISEYLRFNFPVESASILKLAVEQSRESGLAFQAALQGLNTRWDTSARAFFSIKLCEIIRRADKNWARFLKQIGGSLELSPSDLAFVRVVVDPDAMNVADAADGKLVHFQIGAGNSDSCFQVPSLENLFYVTRRHREYYLSTRDADASLDGKPVPAQFAFRFSYMDELRSGKFRLLFRELQVFYRWFNAGTKGVPSFALRQNGRPILDRPGDNLDARTVLLKPTHLVVREEDRERRLGWGEQIQIPGMTVPVSETAEVILALPRGEAVELDARKRIHRSLLELNNVCCNFGKNPGLKEITFSATGGQLVAVMGPSGCGKSTLLGTMTGKVPLSSGAITIDGVDLTKLVKENPRFLGYVPQDDLLFPTLTVAENLRYGARLRLPGAGKQEIEERVREVLQEVDLADRAHEIVGDVNNKTLSGGQRKRLNLALELLTPKTLLLLDEPTSGLSSGDSERIVQILRARADSGALVLVVIHQPSATLFRLFDRLLLLDRGGVTAFYGDPKNAGTYLAGVAPVTNMRELQGLDPGAFLAALETPYRQIDGRVEERRMFEPHYWKVRFESFRKTHLTPVLAPVLKKFLSSMPASRLTLWQHFVLLNRSIRRKLRDSGLRLLIVAAVGLGIVTGLILRSHSPTSGEFWSWFPWFFDKQYALKSNHLLQSFPFLAAIVALFLGMASSVTEINKEWPIMRRERLLKINFTIWLATKFVTLVAANFIPIALYSIVSLLLIGVTELYPQYILYLWLVSAVGVALGLMLSSFDLRDEGVGTTLLPLVLVPQLILCGSPAFSFGELQHLVLQAHDAKNQKIPEIAQIMPSRWAYEGLLALHLNSSRYGGIEIIDKAVARVQTVGNDEYDKLRTPDATAKSNDKAEQDRVTALNTQSGLRNKTLSDQLNSPYKLLEKLRDALEAGETTGQKEGVYHPYITKQLGAGVWDNNYLHNVKGRSTDLLQRYKSLPFASVHQNNEKDFAYLSEPQHRIPTEWYNAVVLVLLALAALAVCRVMIWYGLR